jgi:uncharacterized protein (TIGR01777 family)
MNARRTLIIPGGSGFLGRAVAAFFVRVGWRVIVLSRHAIAPGDGIEHVVWDGRTIGQWAACIDGADAVLNLAGRSVNCRYNAHHRDEITQSRVESTRVIGEVIAMAKRPPKVWLNSSTATIYRHAEDLPQTDEDGEIGEGFSVGVARAWEAAFFEAPVAASTRRIALRTAMVMGPGAGGPFNVFLNLARLRLGGAMGPGTQRVSWVHVDDFCRAVAFLIDREDAAGTINLSAPGAITNASFMQDLRRAAGVKIGLPAHRWMLEIGAVFLRTETELPLKSRWVRATRLEAMGYQFRFPTWPEAAIDLVQRSQH